MVQIRQQLALEMMREADVATVQEIEREIFATPWPRNAYYRELASRSSAHYVVLRQEGIVERPAGPLASELDPTIVGYGGMWRMYDEAHVTTIGVRRELHHRGYGRILFAGLIQAAYDMGAKWVTLEVRTSNDNAMRMYEAFAFKGAGAGPDDVGLIAVTRGPGLAGCLLVGVGVAEGLAASWSLPIRGVNHLWGHIYAAVLARPDLEPPLLGLVVSGAHSDLVRMPEHGRFEVIGRTRDDAAGEA